MAFLPGSKVGKVMPSGSLRSATRSSMAARSGLAICQAANFSSHSARKALPRSAALARAWSTAAGSTAKGLSSKPSSAFMALISSAPILAPCTECEPALVGSGHPMTVVSLMKEGLSVTARAASIAAYSSSIFSSYFVPPLVKSTCCTCQP